MRLTAVTLKTHRHFQNSHKNFDDGPNLEMSGIMSRVSLLLILVHVGSRSLDPRPRHTAGSLP